MISYSDFTNLSKKHKSLFDVVVQTAMWILWRFRKECDFSSKKLRHDCLCDDVILYSFISASSRCKNININWVKCLCFLLCLKKRDKSVFIDIYDMMFMSLYKRWNFNIPIPMNISKWFV